MKRKIGKVLAPATEQTSNNVSERIDFGTAEIGPFLITHWINSSTTASTVTIKTPYMEDLTKAIFVPVLLEQAATYRQGSLVYRPLTEPEREEQLAKSFDRTDKLADFRELAKLLSDPARHHYLISVLGNRGYIAVLDAFSTFVARAKKFGNENEAISISQDHRLIMDSAPRPLFAITRQACRS